MSFPIETVTRSDSYLDSMSFYKESFVTGKISFIIGTEHALVKAQTVLRIRESAVNVHCLYSENT